MEASKGRCIHSKPNTKPVILLHVASLFFTARCSGYGHFQTFRNMWAHPVKDQGPWKMASDFRFMTDSVLFPHKVINIFRFSISFKSTLGNWIFLEKHCLVYEGLKMIRVQLLVYINI